MDHEHTEHIAASPQAVYAAIADVGNLPRFVPQLTGVRATGENRVQVDARYHGHDQQGEPHGSESEHDVSATLDAIRMLVESQI